MPLVVGPRHSGKGTIARVLAKLIGTSNVCGPNHLQPRREQSALYAKQAESLRGQVIAIEKVQPS